MDTCVVFILSFRLNVIVAFRVSLSQSFNWLVQSMPAVRCACAHLWWRAWKCERYRWNVVLGDWRGSSLVYGQILDRATQRNVLHTLFLTLRLLHTSYLDALAPFSVAWPLCLALQFRRHCLWMLTALTSRRCTHDQSTSGIGLERNMFGDVEKGVPCSSM